jgi:DNA topoisomerase-1
MDLCNFRNGNKKYEEKYGSHGITTLHKNHLKFINESIEIDFIGKKGVKNSCIINNKKIQEIIKKLYKLSNKKNEYIFSINYKDEDITITPNDINNYLKSFKITSKDLRTWNANIIFLKNFKKEIKNIKIEDINNKLTKKLIKKSIDITANSLHHTSSICKSSYILKNMLINIENNNNNIIEKYFFKNIKSENILKKLLKNL